MYETEENTMTPELEGSSLFRDPEDVAQVDFGKIFEEARRQSDEFADQNRVTSELLKLEFCI